jgi:hypothetical protein
MKTRIATSFGLALMLVMGVFATMLALGAFDARTITADSGDGSVSTSILASSITAAADPTDPGAIAKWTVVFANEQRLAGGTGEIIIEFEDDVNVPVVIDPSDVTITTTRFSNSETGTTDVTGTLVANPQGVNVRLVGSPKDEAEITLEIGDMEPSTVTEGFQGIEGNDAHNKAGADTTVTVIFRQGAGLKNPTEAKPGFSCSVSGDTPAECYRVKVATTNHATKATSSHANGALIPRTLDISSNNGTRGANVNVIGKGFRNSTTATIWRDADQDGTRDSGEIDLNTAQVGSDDSFTVAITIANPPFVAGRGTAGSTRNAFNAIDGRSESLNNTSLFSLPDYDLRGSIQVTPSTAAIGDTVQLTIKDFEQPGSGSTSTASSSATTSGSTAAQATTGAGQPYVTLGGVVVEVPSFTLNSQGEATFNIDIPNGVAAGSQVLAILDDDATACPACTKNYTDSTRRFTMTISSAELTMTPDTDLVPNQTVTVIGRGYTNGGAAEIADSTDTSSVLIDGDSTGLKANGAAPTNKINEGTKITIDNGGNWSSSIVIPINDTTTTPGAHEFKITDDAGREGIGVLTIAARTVTLSPLESRVGTVVNVVGAGFPADKTKTGAESTPSVAIKYTVSGTAQTVATLTPDAGGNINGTFTVPLNAGIPSTNSVTAEFKYTPTSGSETTSTTATIHEVPRATVTIDPTSGPTGTVVSIVGEGFKTFSTVSELKIGDIDVRPAPIPSTDSLGGFSTTLLVPQLNTGSQAVKAKVSDTVATATYTVIESVPTATPSAVVAAQAPDLALKALIDNNDNLERVWHFDPSKQNEASGGWFLYDTRPIFAAANTVTEVAGGKFYWIKVRVGQDATLGGKARSLFAGWNPVTW